MGILSVLEGPLATLVLGLVLAVAGLVLLREYTTLLRQDAHSTMSAEVLFALVTQTGAPGYLAAFLLAGAVLCGVLAFGMLAVNLTSYLSSNVPAQP